MTGCGLESHWPGIGGPFFDKNLEYAPRPKGTLKGAKWNPKGSHMDPKGNLMDPKGSHMRPKVAPRIATDSPKTKQVVPALVTKLVS